MIATSILNSSVLLTLFTPLLVLILIAATYFFTTQLEIFERHTYILVRNAYVFTFFTSVVAFLSWFFSSAHHGTTVSLPSFHLSSYFKISLRLYYTWSNLAFLMSCMTINAVITLFSHRYLHRDPSYRRFFITISLFAFGINLIILAGNFDLIFAGWELVGLSSFLLIGYFWHRPKAVAAATSAYYIFRVCDFGLLASILITHFFWHDLSLFNDISNFDAHSVLSHVPITWRWILSLSILLPVLSKSAQFPFCYWLPKAMEGPTQSSAIFYGSLSIHVGVFLLIRTMPVWSHTPGFNYVLLVFGLMSAVSATLCAQVQSNIKGQIGYASIAQVGLMLVELSLGFPTIALFHMVGNAFLRCFQLLVSGSILTTHLHMQNVVRTFGELTRFSLTNIFLSRWRPSLYVFAMNEGYFEYALKKIFTTPVMLAAHICNRLINVHVPRFVECVFFSSKEDVSVSSTGSTLKTFAPMLFALCLGVAIDVVFRSYEIVSLFSLIIALFLALAALGEKKRAMRALVLAVFGNIFAFLSVATSKAGLLYLIGLMVSALVAIEALRYVEVRRHIADVKNYLGLYQQFPLAGTMFLLGSLGVISFPVSSTFYGEDLLLSLSLNSGLHFIIFFQLIFILSGIAMIRTYSHVMLGRRDNAMKEINLDFTPAQMCVRMIFFVGGNVLAFVLALY